MEKQEQPPSRSGVGVSASGDIFAGVTSRFILPVESDERGPTIEDVLNVAGLTADKKPLAHVFIGDQKIVPESWHVVRPKPGQMLTINVTPLGGGGGDGGKNPLSTVITVAAIAASAFVAGGGLVLLPGIASGGTFAAGNLGATLLSAGIGVAGPATAAGIAQPPTAPAAL